MTVVDLLPQSLRFLFYEVKTKANTKKNDWYMLHKLALLVNML